MSKFTLLNTSILTGYGYFEYNPITVDKAKELVQEWGYESAIGHQATADILTELLGVSIAVNRVNFKQDFDKEAIVFKLKGRAPEGAILTREQIEEIGYEFGVLRMLPPHRVVPSGHF